MGTSDGHVIGTTKVVDHGDPALRWNLVVLGDGYQAGQIPQFANDVQNFINTLQATPPFPALWMGINVYRVDVSSTDSGAADPIACGGSGAAPHTYFDASFCNGGIHRLLEVNDLTVNIVVAAQMPQATMTMVLVNTPIYGGSGGAVATVSLAASAVEIALHEMGHTAFGFADEYEYWAGCGVDAPGTHDHAPAGEPGQPNITANATASIKWSALVTGGTPLPTTANVNCGQCDPQPNPHPAATVGAYEGAGYYHCGRYRPQFNCRMRALGFAFCAVCQNVITQVIGPHVPAIPVGTYGFISSALDDQVIDIFGANTAPATDVIAFPKKMSGTENQRWQLVASSDPNYFFVQSLLDGQVLDIFGGLTAPATPIIAFPRKSSGVENQLWRPVLHGSGPFFFLESKLNGNVIDIFGALTAPATKLISFPKKTSGIENQLWKFTP